MQCLQLSRIGKELLFSAVEFSARRLDLLAKREVRPDEVARIQESSKNLILVSILIATVTFTAGFAIPGG